MNGIGRALACVLAAASISTAAAAGEAQATGSSQQEKAGPAPSGRFTAQRRPRVTVLELENANAEAVKLDLAGSVTPMLETSLKARTQLVVVERQRLGELLQERRRMQEGMVDIPPGDTASRKLLEQVDAILSGSVSLLRGAEGDGPRIEIDAKLELLDGRVAAVAESSGPGSCRRSVVERLGVALERDFLRPYSGQVKLDLTEPENVRLFLTPIPLEADRERPPERSSTVKIGGEYDTVEPWITDPTTYTAENLLGGWYSLRLARPGYDDLKTEAARWEVRHRSGGLEVYDRLTGRTLADADPELRRFVVHVDPLATEAIDGDARGFVFRKQGGSLAPRVKRQYLDDGFSRVPTRVMLMGGKGLHLNSVEEAERVSDNRECDLFEVRQPAPAEFTPTHVPAGRRFDFSQFKGGELIIDDYRGEIVPVGRYQIVVWDPNYRDEKTGVIVRDHDLDKLTQASLDRETLTLKLEAMGPRPGNRVLLKGRDTHRLYEVPLDFTESKEQRLPADVYTVSTDIPGLDGWRQTLDLQLTNIPPPKYFTRSGPYAPKIDRATEEERKPVQDPRLRVKTRFAVAGRFEVLGRPPDRLAADLFADREVVEVLDLLLRDQEAQAALPRDLARLRERLGLLLNSIDLLVLDARDTARLRKSPEVAEVIQRYLQAGGALLAFVAEAGDYGGVVGAPLVIETAGEPTDRFELVPGDVSGLVPRPGRRAKAGSKRVLPELSSPREEGPWRVLAFTRGRQSPRIVERGELASGGYVVLWLDDPGSLRGPRGEPVPGVQEARTRVEERALKWARNLMSRRYDKGGKRRR